MDVTKPGGIYIIIYLSQIARHLCVARRELILYLPVFLLCYHRWCGSFILTLRRWLLNFQILHLWPRRKGEWKNEREAKGWNEAKDWTFPLLGIPRHSAFRHPLTSHNHPLLYKSSSFYPGRGSVRHHENLKKNVISFQVYWCFCLHVCLYLQSQKKETEPLELELYRLL